MKNRVRARAGWRRRIVSGASVGTIGGLLAGVLGFPSNLAAEEKAADAGAKAADSSSAATDYSNWFDVTAGGAFVSGNPAEFMRQNQVPAGAFGGVENFHYEHAAGKKGQLTLDGRGIFDNHDYLLKFKLDYPDMGYVTAGYREYRTWYDGNGGFFPLNGQDFSIYNNQFAADRGSVWFEAGLRKPDVPFLTFRYSHDFRRGQEDSTIWGDTTLTGGAGTRSIVPSFYNIDEDRDVFQADLAHHLGATDFGVGVRYENGKTDDQLNVLRRPYDPQFQRAAAQNNDVGSDLFNAHAFTDTKFDEKIQLTTGYSFTSLDTDLSGSRIYGADYEPIYDPTFRHGVTTDVGFLDLSGGAELRQYVMNLNLMLTPWDSVSIVPSLRAEDLTIDGQDFFTQTSLGQAPSFAATELPLSAANNRGLVDVTEALEARYSGVTNWLFYARGEWLEGNGDLRERELSLAAPFSYQADDRRLTQKYAVGANWYPLAQLNLGGQYYHKIHTIDYSNIARVNPPDLADLYPGFINDQDFYMDDVNFRITWRPFASLTLVSRYDFQLSTIDTRGDALSEIDSGQITTHIFSETVTWSPLSRWYLQAAANYALDQTESAAESLTGGAVLNPKNNYFNGSFSTGFVLTDKTDLDAQYFYYRASDYADNSLVGLPYGADATEHGVTAGLTHQINARMRWSVHYAFAKYDDPLYGGFNNYQAHMVYSSLRYYF